MAIAVTPEEVAEAGLVYVHDSMPGITRRRAGKGFRYFAPDGSIIKNAAVLHRIENLAIPPAYGKVWICPLENGHIQATGRDARKRKQYRYHAEWIKLANEGKFGHVYAFGQALPRIRQAVDSDLGLHNLSKEKVLATVVWFLDSSLIRIGNEEYVKENKSYGLTTMKTRHCKVDGSLVEFHFVGKRGIKHDVSLADRRMARIVRRIQELPGQELFQYIGHDRAIHSITSADVNSYIKETSGQEFTAKDFRTWGGTVCALDELSGRVGLCGRKAKSGVMSAMRAAASQLRNTPAICRKSYVHPGLVAAYLDGSLGEFLGALGAEEEESEWYSKSERIALAFLATLEHSA